MTSTKPKTVKAWGFAVQKASVMNSRPYIWDLDDTREDAMSRRDRMKICGWTCGPVVRIEVPAPKERKR